MKIPAAFDIETLGLDPLKDRITAIGVKTYYAEKVFTNKNEKTMLTEFWNFVKRDGDVKLIGFNCFSFDLPFLLIRSMKYNLSVVDIRYKTVDLRKVLFNGYNYKKGTLEKFSKFIGYVPKYNGFTAAFIPTLWKEKRFDELEEYLLQDVRMTWKIYERLVEMGVDI